MSDSLIYHPGDNDVVILRKILGRLGAGLTLTGQSAGILTVGGNLAVVSAEVTRATGDTTQYAINDVVNNSTDAGSATVFTFVNAGRVNGGTGYITNVRLVKSTVTTTNAVFRVWLYGTAPTPLADNTPFTLLYANKAIRLGYVDFSFTTEGSGSDSASAAAYNVNLKFACAANSRDLYGVIEAKAAYTPASQEKFWVELTVDQN